MRFALLATLLLAACPDSQPQQAQQVPPPVGAEVPAAPAADGALSGMVAETMDAAGYTYVHLQTKDGMRWAAVQEVALKPGDRVKITNFSWMKGFHSKSLDRTFDEIAFGQLEMAGGGGNPHAPGGAAPSGMTEGDADAMMAAHGSAAPKAVEDAIAKADGGQTVAEVWAGKASLSGKQVTVRGKVVKFTGGVMGTNWVHIQDGSGSADAKTHDLTVTTDDVVSVGDVVTVSGTLVTDKDFGAGYSYAALVEKATLSR